MTTRRRFLAYSAGATLALYGYDEFGIKQAYAQIPGGTLAALPMTSGSKEGCSVRC